MFNTKTSHEHKLRDVTVIIKYLAMISIAEALRYWEQKGHLQKRQCESLINMNSQEMKKLKRLVIQDFSRLSREEMAAVEGRDGSWVDVCTSSGQTCLIKMTYVEGHQAPLLGTCYLRTMSTPAGIISYYDCI